MLENLTLVGGFIILLWLLTLLLYFRASSQHRSLHDKIDALNKRLKHLDK